MIAGVIVVAGREISESRSPSFPIACRMRFVGSVAVIAPRAGEVALPSVLASFAQRADH